MTQRVKALAAKTGALSSTPGSHGGRRELIPSVGLWPPNVSHVVHAQSSHMCITHSCTVIISE